MKNIYSDTNQISYIQYDFFLIYLYGVAFVKEIFSTKRKFSNFCGLTSFDFWI